MFAFVIALLVLDALVLSVAVLLQSGKGGGLAALGGASSTDSFLGGRQATTVLTKASWWCGGIFLALSLVLSGLETRGGSGPQSILEGQIQAPIPVTSPALPLDINPGVPAPTTDSTN